MWNDQSTVNTHRLSSTIVTESGIRWLGTEEVRRSREWNRKSTRKTKNAKWKKSFCFCSVLFCQQKIFIILSQTTAAVTMPQKTLSLSSRDGKIGVNSHRGSIVWIHVFELKVMAFHDRICSPCVHQCYFISVSDEFSYDIAVRTDGTRAEYETRCQDSTSSKKKILGMSPSQ